jgi:hypothetical protein
MIHHKILDALFCSDGNTVQFCTEDKYWRNLEVRRNKGSQYSVADHFDMYMSKAAFISNDLASFTALYVTSQRGHCPLLIRYVNTCRRGMRKGWWGEPSINVID